MEELNNQRWLEKKISGPNNSLTRSGSLGSNRSYKSAQSSKGSDELLMRKPIAPAKPPRSARSSSTGSKDSKETKKIVLNQQESSTESDAVFDKENPDENPYTIIATPPPPTPPAQRIEPMIEPVIEELPRIQLRDVVLDKTMKLDRSNDAIFHSTTTIIKELTKLKNSCDTNGTF